MKLREARVRGFLSRAKLSEKAKVAVATIRDVEVGKHRPSLTTCTKLATALGIPPEEIDECRETMERSFG